MPFLLLTFKFQVAFIRSVDSFNPEGPPFSFLPREKDHLYSVEDDNNRLLIMTNLNAKNFKLIQTSLDDSKDKSKWKEIKC